MSNAYNPDDPQPGQLYAVVKTSRIRLTAVTQTDPNEILLLAHAHDARVWHGLAQYVQSPGETGHTWQVELNGNGPRADVCVTDRMELLDLLVDACAELHQLVNGPHNFAVVVDRYAGPLIV